MREFMHYITNAFYGATGWNDDNTYKELNATARGRFFRLLHIPSHLLTNAHGQSSSTSPSRGGSV